MLGNNTTMMKGYCNTIIKNIVDYVEKHPKESVVIAGMSSFILGNIWQKGLNRTEKRHQKETKQLQKEAIRKQGAQIKDLTQKAEKAEHLMTMNDALINTLESKLCKEGEISE